MAAGSGACEAPARLRLHEATKSRAERGRETLRTFQVVFPHLSHFTAKQAFTGTICAVAAIVRIVPARGQFPLRRTRRDDVQMSAWL